MIRIVAIGFVFIAAVTFLSCDDTFSPKDQPEERTFLYCIANFSRIETSTQVALLSRSYDVAGTNPLVNTTDSFVEGAELELNIRGVTSSFRNASLGPPDTTRYGTPVRYYAARGVVLYPGEVVSVTAILPDGSRLWGSTLIPPVRPLDSHPRYSVGFTTNVNRFTQGDRYVLDWNDGSHNGHLFFPSFTLVYERRDSADVQTLSLPVPMKFVIRNGVSVPVHPRPSTDMHIEFSFDAIDATMRAIAAGDSLKSRYRPVSLNFTVVECDFALTRYFLSVNGSMDQYSLRLDESTFTNVHGGGGVVGSTTVFGINLDLDPRYVRSFGYSTASGVHHPIDPQ